LAEDVIVLPCRSVDLQGVADEFMFAIQGIWPFAFALS
jgi:hypothetical protein